MMTQKQVNSILYTILLLLLCIPAIAMQFSSEVKWSFFDFLVAGILLFSTAFGLQMILKLVKKKSHRIILAIGLLLVLLLVWAELAVGIFGSPFAGS